MKKSSPSDSVNKKSAPVDAKTRRQARRWLEKIWPSLIKPKRLRNVVRRAVRKTKSKEFADKLDAVLLFMATVHDLTQQENAMNPSPALLKLQRSGTVTREIKEEFQKLLAAWKELIAIV
ncbi:MAG: hypothetical protein A2845_05825 [Candidatus Lloydbacteria bacterium RIFCSPHIGHO2_01_FULL_49_22]|uniref:Uncharacterized protein n=1 Tax=Candidatus Lloydbacteria bacterium RIFCSPHIGHO2_01_FULL_49_22 TaxID=1798658 RepID=A0A1G2CXS8_9BACT|nr:MAG: hypothetical protein A2845_05825 [Candidatus Lloydbacteria bacterium RIFCSPHIGHO2_01_FULL_49_22]OGZ09800.1 MAG: hypothetical protein A3C14_00190 [Candidatus Lloydbacteria bacterium RIFCSPHIGHO2_02_FULL_50_18]